MGGIWLSFAINYVLPHAIYLSMRVKSLNHLQLALYLVRNLAPHELFLVFVGAARRFRRDRYSCVCTSLHAILVSLFLPALLLSRVHSLHNCRLARL